METHSQKLTHVDTDGVKRVYHLTLYHYPNSELDMACFFDMFGILEATVKDSAAAHMDASHVIRDSEKRWQKVLEKCGLALSSALVPSARSVAHNQRAGTTAESRGSQASKFTRQSWSIHSTALFVLLANMAGARIGGFSQTIGRPPMAVHKPPGLKAFRARVALQPWPLVHGLSAGVRERR